MVKKRWALAACFALLMTSFVGAQPPPKVKAIVFDFGAVIATTDRAKIIQFLIDTFQVSRQELKPILGKWKEVLNKGENENEFWSSYAASLGMVLPQDWFDEYVKVTAVTEIPGMVALVKNLQKQGFSTPMLSNIHHYQANMVRKSGYYELFEPVLLSYEIGYEKPHREAFTILLDQLQMCPSEIIFIDDKKENIDAANELGIDSLHFISPSKLIDDLETRNIKIGKEIRE